MVIKVGDISIGKDFCVIAGPCAIESKELLIRTAKGIKENISILRGGAFKPRTNRDSFQGLGKEGLNILKEVGEELEVPTITEVMDARDLLSVAESTDILQIGARNMQNFSLLREVGKTKKPVLLKRGFASTIKEWIAAAEYITAEGNNNLFLCERGIRTFETETRFTLDIAGAIIAKRKTRLPVIVDLSHSTGRRELVEPLYRAIKASGLDGVMIEVHCSPEEAKCDKDQALTVEEFNMIFKKDNYIY